jgi:hypothetical protein
MNGRPIKVMLRVYKHEKMLERDFAGFYDAHGAIELMLRNTPDVMVEPYFQLSDTTEIARSELRNDEVMNLAFRAKSGIG